MKTNGSRVIFLSANGCIRILEVEDDVCSLKDLKGDCFDPDYNPEIDPARLKKEEIEFENLVKSEGVFGYVLERWNPAPGIGWEHVDSIFGFVGRFQRGHPKFEHYIVDEYIKFHVPKLERVNRGVE